MPSARDLAFVGCRLLALYFLYGVLLLVPNSLTALSTAFGSAGPSSMSELFYPGRHLLPIIYLLIGLLMSWVLWIGAGRISAMITSGMSTYPEEHKQGWSPEVVLSLGLVILGLWLLAHHLPNALHWLYMVTLGAGADGRSSRSYFVANLLSECLKVVFGLVCILGASVISGVIAKLRRW